MRKWVLILFVVFAYQNVFSQEFEMIRHQVEKGETIRMISRKYKIEPNEIYRLNKFAVDGISKGMVLQLMVQKREEKLGFLPPAEPTEEIVIDKMPTSEEVSETTVTTPQTTSGARKKKPTPAASVAEQKIPVETVVVEATLPVAQNPATEEVTAVAVSHMVSKGETLFNLARKYGVSVEEIKNQNQQLLKKGLQPGQVLSINPNPATTLQAVAQPIKAAETVVRTEASQSVQENVQTPENPEHAISHTVIKGETLFSLSRKYNVSVDDIKNQNAILLRKGLQIGQVLSIMAKN